MTLTSLFAPTFTTHASRAGLEWQGRAITFGEIDARAWRMARALAARGLGPGDRLAVYLPNRLEVIDLYLACTRAGIVYVPINILYRDREAGHILDDAEPRALVLEGDPPAVRDVPCWRVDDLAAEADRQSGEPIAAALDASSPAALIYTSGTTGAAKGAVITHGNLAANGRTLVDAWRFTSADRLLLALPLFHVHGLGNGLHCWLASGCVTRLLPRFDRATAAHELEAFAPTVFFGVPTMYVRLLEIESEAAARIGARARLFVSGSAPLPAQVHDEFRARFGHAILERYGMTETLMTIGNPYDGDRRPGTVGLPLPGVEIRVVDESGADVAPGTGGELLVRSPTVCAGYWRRPDATAAAFAGDWFRTGDLAVRGDDGYVTLQGRRSDLIICAGFNVYPREIEEFLTELPGIAEAAVVGVPDEVKGEVPVAFVVPADPTAGVDLEAAEAACRAGLASFKVPRRFVVLDALPRTALGKVQKNALQEPPGHRP